MKRLALVLLVGCWSGGSKKQPDPISNKTKVDAPMGEARVVQRSQNGGIIQLEGDRSTAMEQAHTEMVVHCGPGNFTITQEGEEAIGTDAFSSGGSSTTTTRIETAWRVHYVCNK